MTTTEFLSFLRSLDVKVWVDNGDLFCNGPEAVLSPSLEAELKDRKGEILAFLRQAGHDSVLQLPTVVPAPEQQHLPFPLTDIQQAYWIGRSGVFELGNVSTHRYMEFESVDLDLERLNQAWRRLIDRHDMLRAVVSSDGQQQILQQVPPYQIEVLDLRGQHPRAVASELDAVRRRMSHQVLPSDQWPLFEIRASRLDDRRIRLHFSFDALTMDFSSRSLLFREWAQLYRNPEISLPPLELSFRDYVLAEVALRDSELYRRSQDYWWSRLSTLPPAPELPLAKNPTSLTNPRFVCRNTKLEPERWLRLKNRATRARLTPSSVLLAAYAEVLRVWSKGPRFTINLTLFNRLPLHPQVNDIMGDFTSLTLVAVDNSAQDTFESRARHLQQQLWNDLDHRYVSGVSVMRELARRQSEAPRVTMPVVFTSTLIHGTAGQDVSPWAWLGEIVYTIGQTPQVWLDHGVSERDGALVFNWDAVEELFPNGLLDDMFNAYCCLLRRLADDGDSWQESWPKMARKLVPPAQLEQRAAVNTTNAPVAAEMLHTLFAKQVSRRPDHLALIASNRSLTYKELYRRSNQLGRRLRQRGARPNSLVAVVMEKGWEQVVAVVGILQSGAAYVPIDPDIPEERFRYLLEHSGVKLVVTQPRLDRNLAWPEGIQRLCVEPNDLAAADGQPLEPVQGPEDLAYVIYTSGSTGQPKGVMIDHRGAVNTILDINQRFGVGPADRVLALSSLSFDLSVYDIFGTLAAGGTIVIPKASGIRDPAHWAEISTKEKVTIWNSVPTLMELLVEYAAGRRELLPHPLRLVLLSGDWIPVTLPDQIKALVDGVQVISLGGATEASIWSIQYPITDVDPASVSIPYGRPMVNQSFHVLNEALEPCPDWVPGQLYIGGIGLAKGYWRDEEKSRASFIKHPRTGERLYRTGDLGRYLPDGNIEFLGREDFQVKIQGYRVELEEIEAALSQYPGVRAAVVKAVGEAQGNKHLVAYAVPEQNREPKIDDLRAFLEQKLPDYMVPSAFMLLDALPLTPNGKVDRKALPAKLPQVGVEPPQHPDAEKKNLTMRIGQLVARVLKVDHVDSQANLLNLGATSVDMIRIANLLDNELSFRPKIDRFYRLPTVAALAQSYEHHQLQGRSPKERGESATEPTPESVLASFKLLADPLEREAFKKKQPGLRRRDDEKEFVQLPIAESNDTLKKQYAEHRSHRHFAQKPVPFAQLSRFLSCLHQIKIDGNPKYLYGSAGGLYPVQTYLYVKPGCAEKVSGGTYYYHPVDHRLVSLAANVNLDRGIYGPIINQPIFNEAAFAIFLIAQLGAIAPMYGEHSMHFATIEAGAMTQLLETAAPACGIGLCQIGGLDFKKIRHLFALDEGHVLVHSLLGGQVDNSQRKRSVPFQEPMSEREEGKL